MINHPNRSKIVFDREAIIGNVSFSEGHATFEAQGHRWRYSALSGRMYVNTVGEPVHQSQDGSFCLSNGQSFGEVLSNAKLLNGMVSPVRQ